MGASQIFCTCSISSFITTPNDKYRLTHENMIKASACCCTFSLRPLQSSTTVSMESKSGGSENLIFDPCGTFPEQISERSSRLANMLLGIKEFNFSVPLSNGKNHKS